MNAHDIDVWAREQVAGLSEKDRNRSDNRREQLLQLRKDLRQSDPNRFPAGSPQYTLALFERKAAMKRAVSLGYAPPEEIALELGIHALELGLGI